MQVSVGGSRTERADWEAVRGLSKEELPPLTPAEKQTARTLRIPEEDYARNALAARRTAEKLIEKSARFARLLADKARAANPDLKVEAVRLDTLDDCFDVNMTFHGAPVPLRVAEEIVDDLFERGSRDAEERLSRIVELAFRYSRGGRDTAP
jgi:hypothetical protein